MKKMFFLLACIPVILILMSQQSPNVFADLPYKLSPQEKQVFEDPFFHFQYLRTQGGEYEFVHTSTVLANDSLLEQIATISQTIIERSSSEITDSLEALDSLSVPLLFLVWKRLYFLQEYPTSLKLAIYLLRRTDNSIVARFFVATSSFFVGHLDIAEMHYRVIALDDEVSPYLKMQSTIRLGFIETFRGRLSIARSYLEDGYTQSVRGGYSHEQASALNALGYWYLKASLPDSAFISLEKAETVHLPKAYSTSVFRLGTNYELLILETSMDTLAIENALAKHTSRIEKKEFLEQQTDYHLTELYENLSLGHYRASLLYSLGSLKGKGHLQASYEYCTKLGSISERRGDSLAIIKAAYRYSLVLSHPSITSIEKLPMSGQDDINVLLTSKLEVVAEYTRERRLFSLEQQACSLLTEVSTSFAEKAEYGLRRIEDFLAMKNPRVFAATDDYLALINFLEETTRSAHLKKALQRVRSQNRKYPSGLAKGVYSQMTSRSNSS